MIHLDSSICLCHGLPVCEEVSRSRNATAITERKSILIFLQPNSCQIHISAHPAVSFNLFLSNEEQIFYHKFVVFFPKKTPKYHNSEGHRGGYF